MADAELAAHRHPIFPGESPDYSAARKKLMEAEIEARRVPTDLAEARRQLPPGPVISKDYRFTDAGGKELGLPDLMGRTP